MTQVHGDIKKSFLGRKWWAMGSFRLQRCSGVFFCRDDRGCIIEGAGGTDCSCNLLVTSVISLTAGVELTSDTRGLAKLCPGGSDCRLTSSTMGSGIVGSDFLPTTRGAFAGFAVNTKAASGSRCPTQSTTVLGGTGCTGQTFLFFRWCWVRDW